MSRANKIFTSFKCKVYKQTDVKGFSDMNLILKKTNNRNQHTQERLILQNWT